MPFTLSHPAIVLPLRRWGLPLSALALGSMAPDFPSFVIVSGRSEFSHSLPGLFLASLPMGLGALWLFHVALKWPLLSLLPKAHRAKLTPVASQFHCRSWVDLSKIAIAVLLGAFSHFLWDNLTHNGWWISFIRWLPDSLADSVNQLSTLNTPFGKVSLFDVLQYGSSLLGLIFLAYCYMVWFRGAEKETRFQAFQLSGRARRNSIAIMAAGMGVALLFVGLRMNSATEARSLAERIQSVARPTVITSLKLGIVEILVFCLTWHWYERQSKNSERDLVDVTSKLPHEQESTR